LILDIMFVPDM